MAKFQEYCDGHELVSRVTESAFYDLMKDDVFIGFEHPLFTAEFFGPLLTILCRTTEFRNQIALKIKSHAKQDEMFRELWPLLDNFNNKNKQAVKKLVDAPEGIPEDRKLRVYFELSTKLLQDGRVGMKLLIESILVDMSNEHKVAYAERSARLVRVFTHTTRLL